MKRLGGEIQAKRLRKKLRLSRSRMALASLSFVAMLVCAAVYVAAIPGFTPPPTYKMPHSDAAQGNSFAALDIAKTFGGGETASSGDGAAVEGSDNEAASAGLLASLATVTRTTLGTAAAESGITLPSESASSAGDSSNGTASGQPSGDSSSDGSVSPSPSGPSDSSSSSSSDGASSSLTSAEEAEFHSFLVNQFNALASVPADQGEVAGMLETCVQTGSYANASACYSRASSSDATIDSAKASLNRKAGVAEKSRYYGAWEALELACNSMGNASVQLLNGCRLASSGGSSSAGQIESCIAQTRTNVGAARSYMESARGQL